VCCSVLQFVAVCCSVNNQQEDTEISEQSVCMCCSVLLQCVVLSCSELQCVAVGVIRSRNQSVFHCVCVGVLQCVCVAVSCSDFQYVALWCSIYCTVTKQKHAQIYIFLPLPLSLSLSLSISLARSLCLSFCRSLALDRSLSFSLSLSLSLFPSFPSFFYFSHPQTRKRTHIHAHTHPWLRAVMIVAVCCSLLQSVTVCCSLLQSVAEVIMAACSTTHSRGSLVYVAYLTHTCDMTRQYV